MKFNDKSRENDNVVLTMLLSLHANELLIVPNVSVAEIIATKTPTPYNNSPEWLLGSIEWRGVQIPLLSVERMRDQNFDETPAMRYAVFNSYTGSSDVPFFAIELQAIPKMLQITPDDVKALASAPVSLVDTMRIETPYGRAAVPNLAVIGEKIAQFIAN